MGSSPSLTPSLLANLDAAQAMLAGCAVLDQPLQQAADLVARAIREGHKVLTAGNGGSAADAMHLSGELLGRFIQDRRPYPAICLAANGSDLTGITNDYSYEHVFERQVRGLAQSGDVLICFSSSGNSRNLLLAIDAAHAVGATTVSFLGKGGGFTAGRSTIELIVPDCTITARIQEAQKLLLHTLCELVEHRLGDIR